MSADAPVKNMGVGRKKENYDRGRVEFLADPAWIRRVDTVAQQLGLNLSSYIRMVVSERVREEEAARPTPAKKRKPAPPDQRAPS